MFILFQENKYSTRARLIKAKFLHDRQSWHFRWFFPRVPSRFLYSRRTDLCNSFLILSANALTSTKYKHKHKHDENVSFWILHWHILRCVPFLVSCQRLSQFYIPTSWVGAEWRRSKLSFVCTLQSFCVLPTTVLTEISFVRRI